MDSMLPAADSDTRSTNEYIADTKPMDISSVPFFQRPMDASENDKPTGRYDETGALEYKTALGNTYFVRPAEDQRTTRTKIIEDVVPVIKKYLADPKAPTADQAIAAAKAIAGDAWETISIPGDLLTGEKDAANVTMGDVFGTTVKTGIASAAFKVPGGDETLRIFGGAKASYAPGIRDIPWGDKSKGIEYKFRTEATPETLENLSIDFENDPSGSMVRMMDEIERSPEKYQKTLEEVIAGGWTRGKDNLLRFEIDDSKSKVFPKALTTLNKAEIKKIFKGHDYEQDGFKNPYDPNSDQDLLGKKKLYSTLEDVLEHPDLFENYPELRNIPVIIDSSIDSGTLGYFDRRKGLIGVREDFAQDREGLRSTLIHEIQHAVQRLEDFESGTSGLNADVITIGIAAKNSPTIKKLEKDYEQDFKNYTDTLYKIEDNFVLKDGQELARKLLSFRLEIDNLKDESFLLDLLGKQDPSKAREDAYNLASKNKSDKLDNLAKQRSKFKYGSKEYREFDDLIKKTIYEPNPVPYITNLYPYEKLRDLSEGIVSRTDTKNYTGKSTFSSEDNKYGQRLNQVYELIPREEKERIKSSFIMDLGFQIRDITEKLDSPEKKELFKDIVGLDPDQIPDRIYNNMGKLLTTMGKQLPEEPINPIIGYASGKKFGELTRSSVIYSSKSGEVEARNAQTRMDFSPQKRREVSPEETEDVTRDIQWTSQDVKRAEKGEDIFKEKNIFKQKTFAEGGAVNNMSMKQQMSLFEYGGIADDGMTKDPVSGNNIPPGSLAKEVRDDVPAMLSEGEYVVPADVLRFYGVNFFENLRNQAKNGLQDMEQNGRIGGTPMNQQDVARNMQQPMMAPAPIQAAQGAMMQAPMRIQQQPAPQAMGNAMPQQPVMANKGKMIQGYAGEDGSYVSSWTPSRARWSSPMFQGTSSQQANIEAAQAEAAATEAAESITYMRTHYNQLGETTQIVYVGTTPDNATPQQGQEQLLSDYPLTEAEWAAYKKEMSRSSGDDGGGSTPPEEITSAGSDTSWMEGIDWGDSNSVKAWANKTLNPTDKTGQILNKLGQAGGAIPGGIASIAAGNRIAKVRGAAEVAKALGDEDLYKYLTGQAEQAVEKGSLFVSAIDKLGLISGDNYSKQILDTLPKSAITGTLLQEVSPAGTTVTQEQLSNLYSDDGQPSLTTTTIGGKEYVTGSELPKSSSSGGGETTKTVTTSSGGTGTVSKTPVSSEVMAAGGVYNEGGLMAKNKTPKKKTRKYNKGGLAGKK